MDDVINVAAGRAETSSRFLPDSGDMLWTCGNKISDVKKHIGWYGRFVDDPPGYQRWHGVQDIVIPYIDIKSDSVLPNRWPVGSVRVVLLSCRIASLALPVVVGCASCGAWRLIRWKMRAGRDNDG